jgi:Na+/H+-dicarboxylate symporter
MLTPPPKPPRRARYPSFKALNSKLRLLVRTRLWAQVLTGMVLGITVGILVSPSGAHLIPEHWANIVAGWLVLPGQVFLALIQMVVIPLVVVSVILGILSSGDPIYLRRLGIRLGPYFVATTTIAVGLGVVVVFVICPGNYVDSETVRAAMASSREVAPVIPATSTPSLSIPERIVTLIPTNPLMSALDNSMLDIVIFALLMGVALVGVSRERAQPLIDLLGSIRELTMVVIGWAMLLAPIAVFGLMSQITIKIGLDVFLGMSVYVGTVLLGLVLLLAVYLLIVWVIGRRAPWTFLRQIREVQLLAFSTSSSAAVMPLSLKTAEDILGIRPSISKFVIPVGATVNMDGTALYQVVAAVFLTQVFDVELTMGGLFLLTATTIGASIGAPSSPGVGIVILATILQGIGVPPSGIALIIGVDRILDMSRTTVNVTGDLAACVVMERWTGPDAIATQASPDSSAAASPTP